MKIANFILLYLIYFNSINTSIVNKHLDNYLMNIIEVLCDVVDNWYLKHEEFLNEKSINPTTSKEYFTHRKLVAV